MQRYFMKLAYNGTRFHGWQVQPNGHSVQEEISRAFDIIWKIQITLVGCGRTDTGVHARNYYAHFELNELKSLQELMEMTFRLNRYLDEDIVVLDLFPVPADLHARFSAISRTYQYQVHTRKDPFLNDFSWFVPQMPDVEAMNKGAGILKETSDFTSFSKLHSDVKTNLCHVDSATWERTDHQLTFSITADRFLRNMVRAIVGTLIDLGQGKITPEKFRQIIAGKDRSLAGESAPAKGLFLTGVRYAFNS